MAPCQTALGDSGSLTKIIGVSSQKERKDRTSGPVGLPQYTGVQCQLWAYTDFSGIIPVHAHVKLDSHAKNISTRKTRRENKSCAQVTRKPCRMWYCSCTIVAVSSLHRGPQAANDMLFTYWFAYILQIAICGLSTQNLQCVKVGKILYDFTAHNKVWSILQHTWCLYVIIASILQ